MEPVSPIILVIQILLKYGPAFAIQIMEIIRKKDLTDADWDKLETLIKKPFDSYFPPK